MRYIAPILALVAAGLVGWYTLQPSAATLNGLTMGSTWSVRLLTAAPPEVQREIQAKLDAMEDEMSTWRAGSAISRFNASRSTEWFGVSADFAKVIAEAQRVSQVTGGAFDVTVKPLIELWDPRKLKATGELPSEAAVAAALKHVDYHKLEVRLNPPAIRKLDPEMGIEVAGLAPGYAAECIAAILQRHGLNAYLIDVGGELCVAGEGELGRGWHVGLEAPIPGSRMIHRRVILHGGGLSTSGDYRNYFEKDGVRYSHFLDPRTGRPIVGPLTAVTTVHASTMTADAFATALMVMGPESGFGLAEAMGMPALFIMREGEGLTEKMTRPFEGLLVKPE